ncbi:myb/SANT-like DNA-binding domain-containing protein 3 isoform X4 [Pyxicephalus adspersus]|uniref:myb/SANT-like DNA-binding domain-containing protein 3 isoform X4 n=1 Tax=Pyxicephalus adspersus TaxID=30357 RepID=UPI003B5B3562
MAGTSPIFLLILILLIVLSMRSIHIFNLSKKMQNNDVLKPAKYFSELEKNVLLALVEKYKYVLECKKSDARTIALKQRTWQALAHEYNSQPSVSLRDFKQLKKCWENIKARTRKIMAHERREKVMRCGLGSSNIKEKVASMIPDQIYYVQTPSEEESTYNHEPSKTALELDCKKVNLLDLELLIDEQGKIQTKPFNKATETESLCDESSPSSSVEKVFQKGDLEILIDEQGKIQTEPVRNMSGIESVCAEGSSPSSVKKVHPETHQSPPALCARGDMDDEDATLHRDDTGLPPDHHLQEEVVDPLQRSLEENTEHPCLLVSGSEVFTGCIHCRGSLRWTFTTRRRGDT